eukprot:6210590-Pleurochrysis_carterae.AAC.2
MWEQVSGCAPKCMPVRSCARAATKRYSENNETDRPVKTREGRGVARDSSICACVCAFVYVGVRAYLYVMISIRLYVMICVRVRVSDCVHMCVHTCVWWTLRDSRRARVCLHATCILHARGYAIGLAH